MSYIRISTNSVNELNEGLRSVGAKVAKAEGDVLSVKNRVFGNIQARRNIGNRLSDVENKIEGIKNDLFSLHNLIRYSTDMYTVTEKQLTKELGE